MAFIDPKLWVYRSLQRIAGDVAGQPGRAVKGFIDTLLNQQRLPPFVVPLDKPYAKSAWGELIEAGRAFGSHFGIAAVAAQTSQVELVISTTSSPKLVLVKRAEVYSGTAGEVVWGWDVAANLGGGVGTVMMAKRWAGVNVGTIPNPSDAFPHSLPPSDPPGIFLEQRAGTAVAFTLAGILGRMIVAVNTRTTLESGDGWLGVLVPGGPTIATPLTFRLYHTVPNVTLTGHIEYAIADLDYF